jgi:short-subunit dehydrogenase
VPPLTVYSSTKGAVDRLSDGLRRELLPWGIRVMRVHPSAVTGTEFKQKAVADGGVKYRTLALGRISRDYVARKIVQLVEHPQRSLYLGRLYDVAVFLEELIPSFVDWYSSNWVRDKRKKEFSTARAKKSLKAEKSSSWIPFVLAALGFILIRTVLKEKSLR